jgi:branched-chain amino acid transport system permease protein
MQFFINGIVTGLNIAVLSLAFSAVYLSTRIFHVALGGVYVLVPFVAWAALQHHLGWMISISLALVSGVILSLSCEWLNHRWLEKKQVGSGAHTISSLGIYLVVVQSVALIWGNDPKVLRDGLDRMVQIGTAAMTLSQIVTAIASASVIALFYAWLYQSNHGLQFRAMSGNPKELALRGYNIDQLRLLAFGLSGLLCAVSSLLFAYDVGFDPNAGLITALLAIVAFVVGGQNSFAGATLGGICLGILRSSTVWFLSSTWQDAITFLVLVAFLIARPHGILGKRARLEAEV